MSPRLALNSYVVGMTLSFCCSCLHLLNIEIPDKWHA